MRQLKVVMAQINLLVGDIDGNAERIIGCAREAHESHAADMVVFPELTLTGYPPEDLLLRPSLVQRVDKALSRILAAAVDTVLVFGLPLQREDRLFNALVVVRGSQLLATYYKQCLPNYQVFDEHRYFAAGAEPCVLELFGTRIGFTVCEDLWEAEPVLQARAAGARALININASPYHVNKVAERQQLLAERSTQAAMPIVYVNLLGGQDELVFDGGSMAVSASGELMRRAPSYQEGLFAVDMEIDAGGACHIQPQQIATPLSAEAEVYHALVLGVRDYVNKNGFKGVVLGLSGGIDSAVTLTVAVDALGAERVEAVMMPFDYTSQLSIDASAQQARVLGVDYRIIPIDGIYQAFLAALEQEFAGHEVDTSEQNIQARARGVILMGISNKKGLLVLTTGNKSEIAVGYSTLYGDMAGGFDALKDVPKTLVYRLANYRNKEYAGSALEAIPQDVIDRPPSAELAPDQKDEDNLPPYEVLDPILELYVEQDQSAAAIVAKGYDSATVRRVLRLVDLNEYKRRQSPIGVRLTQRGFGKDRRYPITNAWPLGD